MQTHKWYSINNTLDYYADDEREDEPDSKNASDTNNSRLVRTHKWYGINNALDYYADDEWVDEPDSKNASDSETNNSLGIVGWGSSDDKQDEGQGKDRRENGDGHHVQTNDEGGCYADDEGYDGDKEDVSINA